MAKHLSKLLGIIAVGVAIGITGCSSKKPELQQECIVEDGEKAPLWVCYPDRFGKGMITAVGIAEKMPPSLQLSQAAADGRNRLASRIATEVRREIRRYQQLATEEGDSSVTQQLEDISIQLSRVLLRGSRVLDRWQSENGTLYLLVGVPKGQVQTLLKRRLRDLDLKFRQLEQ